MCVRIVANAILWSQGKGREVYVCWLCCPTAETSSTLENYRCPHCCSCNKVTCSLCYNSVHIGLLNIAIRTNTLAFCQCQTTITIILPDLKLGKSQYYSNQYRSNKIHSGILPRTPNRNNLEKFFSHIGTAGNRNRHLLTQPPLY